MSTFQVHEWWRCTCLDVEECGPGCLCVANIDNASDGYDKVIIGSYNGILHIYSPTGSQSLNDCLIELNLQKPILQVAAGRFMSISSDLYLAVLHPRLLVIYKLTSSIGSNEDGNEYKLNKTYQHQLDRSAANMTYGPFGGVQGHDCICVQSLDGTICIFEQERFSFMRFLPNFLLPGPLAYARCTDAFITVSSSYNVESYSFQVLAVGSDVEEESQLISKGKKIKADWSFNIGEFGLEVSVIEFKNRKPLIVVIGEHSFFCIECTGSLSFVRKFENAISCYKSFPSPDGSKLHTILCTESKQILVFKNANLIWAAKLDEVPTIIDSGTFAGTCGMLVRSNDQCRVSCSYLGTTPSLFALPRSQHRDSSLARIDEELVKINRVIAERHLTGSTLHTSNDKDDLKIFVNIPNALDKRAVSVQHGGQDNIPSITAQISLKVDRRVTDVQIMLPTNQTMNCTIKNLCIPAISEFERPPMIQPSFFAEGHDIPPTLNQQILVYHKQASGVPKVLSIQTRLPLSLVAIATSPIKKLPHHVTLNSSYPCVNLMELFSDFVCDESGPNCVGFEYVQGTKATVLTSKSSNRYRIQCDDYEGLWLITDELVYRINQKHPDVTITNQEQPSLEEYARIIDQHFQLRQMHEEIKFLLNQRAHQYRVIQRRLLTRFKDKTPQSLNCLDTLLEGTHTQLLALADAAEDNDKARVICSHKLSAASQLVILLTKLWKNLSQDEENSLRSILCVDQTYEKGTAMGWEEMVDSSITALIKTTSRLDVGGSTTTHAAMPQDTVKIKKHLAILMDRIGKGVSILCGSHNLDKIGEPSNRHQQESVDSVKNIYKEITNPTLMTKPPGINHPMETSYYDDYSDLLS